MYDVPNVIINKKFSKK